MTNDARFTIRANHQQEAESILAEVYSRIETAASNTKTFILIGGESDRTDLDRRIANMGTTGMPRTPAGNIVENTLKRDGFDFHVDGHGVRISWEKTRR